MNVSSPFAAHVAGDIYNAVLSSSLLELNDSVNENSDTVGQIVHYIMKNEGRDMFLFWGVSASLAI